MLFFCIFFKLLPVAAISSKLCSKIACIVNSFLACFNWFCQVGYIISSLYFLLFQYFYIMIAAVCLVFNLNYLFIPGISIECRFCKFFTEVRKLLRGEGVFS